MLYHLPPAGNRITWSAGVDESAVRGLFAPWEASLYASGTAALAAVLAALRTRYTTRDEVILAAYNCPDLVSAARFAGCVPRLVDLAPDRPWMDLVAVEDALSPRTLAILAVDMFGIPERYGPLREFASENGCALIQDSAQAFPKRAGDAVWHGDAVVLSFGRGKPVSLLAGGVVLCRDRALARELAQPRAMGDEDETRHARQVFAYNLLRTPQLYWLPARLPKLGLGQTRYEPLEAITAMPPWLKRRVPPAVAAYRARGSGVESQYASLTLDGIADVARGCGLSPTTGLSRYPLLAADGASRDRICRTLARYGASCFYGRILPEVSGLETLLDTEQPLSNARDFAARLFTLPTHDGVQHPTVAAIGRLLGAKSSPMKALRETI